MEGTEQRPISRKWQSQRGTFRNKLSKLPNCEAENTSATLFDANEAITLYTASSPHKNRSNVTQDTKLTPKGRSFLYPHLNTSLHELAGLRLTGLSLSLSQLIPKVSTACCRRDQASLSIDRCQRVPDRVLLRSPPKPKRDTLIPLYLPTGEM